MDTIIRPRLTSAHNGEHYEYHDYVTSQITATVASAFNLDVYRTNYMDLFYREKAIYASTQIQLGTQELTELDKQRDSVFCNLMNTIKAFSNNFDAEKKAQGMELERICTPYQGANKKPLDEETGLLLNLVDDLKKSDYTLIVSSLGLTAIVNELGRLNTAYRDLSNQRNEANRILREQGNMKTIRPLVDQAFWDITSGITAVYSGNALSKTPDATIQEGGFELINALNARTIRFNDVIDARKATLDTKRKKTT